MRGEDVDIRRHFDSGAGKGRSGEGAGRAGRQSRRRRGAAEVGDEIGWLVLVAFAGGRGLSLSGGDIPTHRRHSAGGNSVKVAGVAGRETEEAPSTARRACDCAIDRQKTQHRVHAAREASLLRKENPGARVGRMFIVGVDRCGGRGGPYERAGSEIRPGNTTWEIRPGKYDSHFGALSRSYFHRFSLSSLCKDECTELGLHNNHQDRGVARGTIQLAAWLPWHR